MIPLKAVLVQRVGPRGEIIPHLMLVDTRTGTTYEVLNVHEIPSAWRPGATLRHEATIEIEE
jgi:hypothetical protein